VAFDLFGLIPRRIFLIKIEVIPYIFKELTVNLLVVSSTFTAIEIFGIGSAKCFFTHKKWYFSGLETLLVGWLHLQHMR
jgi:hypothetical protein